MPAPSLPARTRRATGDGYIPLPSRTFSGFALLRSNLKSGSDADIAQAVAYGKRVKFYPLSQASNPPETKFVDAIDVVFDSTIPYDLRFLDTLDRFMQREPWLDRVMIDFLKTIGIEKGKPFNPDETTRKVLNDAVREAHAWLDNKYANMFTPPYYKGAHWGLPALKEVIEGLETDFANPNAYPVDGRGVTYYYAFFSPKHLGEGQFYLMEIANKDSKSFDRGRTYRLNVPANPPAFTYIEPTSKLQFNGTFGLTTSFKNEATDYDTGDEFHFESAVGKDFGHGVVLGVVGYDYRQLSDDTGAGVPAILNGFKGEVDAIGPGPTYTTEIGNIPFILNARHYEEFNATHRFDNSVTLITGTFVF